MFLDSDLMHITLAHPGRLKLTFGVSAMMPGTIWQGACLSDTLARQINPRLKES